MTRPRGDPELIYRAQRAGIFARLRDEVRMDELDAEQWLAAWEHEAEATGRERGSTGYWDEAWDWIETQRNSPKTDMNAEGEDGQVYGG